MDGIKKFFNDIAKQFYFKEEASLKEGDRSAVVKSKSFLRVFQSVSGKMEEGTWPPVPGETYKVTSPTSAGLCIPPVKTEDAVKKLFQTGRLS